MGQVLSGSGSATQAVAQSWLVLELSTNSIWLGVVSACTFVPILLASAYMGSIVDHVDRRRILIGTQAALLAISATLGVLTEAGAVRLWVLVLGALATGTVTSLDMPARQIFVLELVGLERTANAVSLNEVVLNLSRVVGPALGGLVLAFSGPGACFLVNAASYLPPLLVLLAGATRRAVSARHSDLAGVREPRRRGDTAAGLRYVWSQRPLRAVTVMAAVSGMIFNFSVAVPLFAVRTFHEHGLGYGLMIAAFGVGAVPGALAATFGDSFPSGRQVRALALGSGLLVLATAFSPDFPVALAGLACCGAVSIWYIARANAFAQLRAAPELRGRTMGIWTMALPGMNPLTGLAVAGVAEGFGGRGAFGLGGLCLTVVVLAAWKALSDRSLAGGRAAARSEVTS